MDLQKIINSMQKKELDTLLILKRENITYLSGFKPSSLAVIIVKDDATLYTSKMELNDAENKSKIPVKDFNSLDEIKEELKGRIGVEKSIPLSFFKKICENRDIKTNDIIESMRIIKDNKEITYIKKSIEIAEKSLKKTNISGTEFQVSAELEYNMKFNGSLKPAFETIVASGSRSSIPHATISKNNLETPVVIDWGAIYNNYCSDITRTFVQREEEIEIYEIVLEAQQKAIKVIKPGVKASYIDKVARNVIEEYGYSDNFTHSTGHGLGLEVHEDPNLSIRSDFKLEKGMVVTVEPGIYLPDRFGIRIEDDIVINNRAKVLTNINK